MDQGKLDMGDSTISAFSYLRFLEARLTVYVYLRLNRGSMHAAVGTRLIDPSLAHVIVTRTKELGADAAIILSGGGTYAGNRFAYII